MRRNKVQITTYEDAPWSMCNNIFYPIQKGKLKYTTRGFWTTQNDFEDCGGYVP